MKNIERKAAFVGIMAMNVAVISFFDGIMAANNKNFGLWASLILINVIDLSFLAGYYLMLKIGDKNGN